MAPALNHYLREAAAHPKWWLLVGLLAAGLAPRIGQAQTGAAQPQAPMASDPTDSDTEKPSQLVDRVLQNWSETAEMRRNLLAESSLSGSVVWLDGDTRSALAFWYPHSATTPTGSILMLHAAGQHPVWPETLKNLVEHLPRHGWSILTIAVPDYHEFPARRPLKIAELTTADQASADPDGTTAPEEMGGEPTPPTSRQAIDQQVFSNMEAGFAFLQEHGITSVALLGEGQGASRVLAYPAGRTNDGVSVAAKILLNLPHRLERPNFVTDISTLLQEIPTLDIYFDDFGLAEQAARTRAAKIRATPNVRCRQTKFSGWAAPMDPARENRLTKTIRGFLKTYQVGDTPVR